MNLKKRTKFFILLILGLLAVAIVQTEILFSPETFINATDITSSGFSSDSGNNLELINLIDNRSWNGTEAAGQPWNIYITFTNVSEFDYIESLIKYNSSTTAPSQHEINMSIWCVTDGAYVEVEDMSIDLDYHYRSTKFINSSHFITPVLNGTVVIKLTHIDPGTTGHRIWIDLLRLVNEPRAEQIIINNTVAGGTFNQTPPCGYNISGTQYTYLCQSPTSVAMDAVDTSTGAQTNLAFNKDYIDMSHNNGTSTNMHMGNLGFQFSSGVAGDPKLNLNEWINITADTEHGGYNITHINNTNMSGQLNISGNYTNQTTAFDGTGFMTAHNYGTLRTQISATGVQYWRIWDIAANAEVGEILYAGSNTYAGIVMRNATRGERKDLLPTSSGLRLDASSTSSANTNYFQVNNTGNLYLSGAGKGITLLSPDGNDWCVTVTNGGALNVATTPCLT